MIKSKKNPVLVIIIGLFLLSPVSVQSMNNGIMDEEANRTPTSPTRKFAILPPPQQTSLPKSDLPKSGQPLFLRAKCCPEDDGIEGSFWSTTPCVAARAPQFQVPLSRTKENVPAQPPVQCFLRTKCLPYLNPSDRVAGFLAHPDLPGATFFLWF